MTLPIPVKLILSLLIGAAIGLERESYRYSHEKPELKNIVYGIGVRTFSLIALLGSISGIILTKQIELFIVINSIFIFLIVADYILHSILTKDVGITTEIVIIITYCIGHLIVLEIVPISLVVAISVICLLILSRKHDISSFVVGIDRRDVSAFISFALIALVILPFLPNVSYSLDSLPYISEVLLAYGIQLNGITSLELINPFRLWLIVALITGVDVAGYLFERALGNKSGRIISSLVGGFVSGTATTISLARESLKHRSSVNLLVGCALIAVITQLLQLIALVLPINSSFVVKSTPLLLFLVLGSFISAFIFFLKSKENLIYEPVQTEIRKKEIFSTSFAFRFALFFIGVRFITKIALLIWGEAGFVITNSIVSVTSTDAPAMNIAELVRSIISYQTAVKALLGIHIVNFIGRIIYAFIVGAHEFAIKLSIGISIIVLFGAFGLLFV